MSTRRWTSPRSRWCARRWMRGFPVFGICRGQQVINVALGGSLLQHIDGHDYHGHPRDLLAHSIDVVPGFGAVQGHPGRSADGQQPPSPVGEGRRAGSARDRAQPGRRRRGHRVGGRDDRGRAVSSRRVARPAGMGDVALPQLSSTASPSTTTTARLRPTSPRRAADRCSRSRNSPTPSAPATSTR